MTVVDEYSLNDQCGIGTLIPDIYLNHCVMLGDLLPKDPTCVNGGDQDSLGVDIIANVDLGGQLSAVGIGGLLQRRFRLRCFCIFLRERSAAKANRQHEACEYAFHGGSLFAFSA